MLPRWPATGEAVLIRKWGLSRVSLISPFAGPPSPSPVSVNLFCLPSLTEFCPHSPSTPCIPQTPVLRFVLMGRGEEGRGQGRKDRDESRGKGKRNLVGFVRIPNALFHISFPISVMAPLQRSRGGGGGGVNAKENTRRSNCRFLAPFSWVPCESVNKSRSREADKRHEKPRRLNDTPEKCVSR